MLLSSSDGSGWLPLLVIAVTIQWLIVWSAVRVATGRIAGSRQTVFVAATSQRPEGLVLTVENRGTAAAVNLAVRWQGQPEDAAFLSALLLAPGEQIHTVIGQQVDPADRKVAVVHVRHMTLEGIYQSDRLAVLAPPTAPASAIVAPRPPMGVVG